MPSRSRSRTTSLSTGRNRPRARGRSGNPNRNTSTSYVNPVSNLSTTGKTSMKAPFKFFNSGLSLTKKVARIEKSIKNNEVKYLFSQFQTITVSITPVVTLLNGMQRGDTIQKRTADKVRLLQFELSGILHTGNNANVRIMIVSDKSPEGTAIKLVANSPAQNYLFAGNGFATIQPYQMLNFNDTSIYEEFRIFYDKTFSLDTTSKFLEQISIKQKIDVSAEYKGGDAGTVADITKNALYLVVFGASTAGATPATTSLQFDACLYFSDD